jgi:hypothetical protein
VRNTVLVAVAALALVAGAAASAEASSQGVVASASGGYSFGGPLLGGSIEVHPFAWTVAIHSDGSVLGRFNYTQVRDGVELTVRGSLTCAVIRDDHVWAGGMIEDSSRESLIGLDAWFQAQDNGEPGPDANPDMSSTVGAGPAGAAQQYCDDAPAVRFPFLIDTGNLQVRA